MCYCTPMLEVYHVPGTRSTRITWLCEELGVAYEVVEVDFSPAYLGTPQWRALNPVGKVPVLKDGELTMFESGAMVEHILDRHGDGRLRPPVGTDARAIYRQWCWFAEATLARPLGEVVNHARAFGPEAIPAVLDEMKDRARLSLSAVDDAVSDREYLCGDEFTAADIMMGYSLLLASMLGLLQDARPALDAYYARLSARPAYQRARGER